MKSLIRSDFYKLRKAKSFWVCMILAVALAVFSVLIMDFSVKLMDKVPQQAAQEEAALEESGLNISTDGIPMSSADLNASNMLLMQFAGTTTILISIFVSLFVGGEFSHGTIKNLASKNHTRTQIYLSKIIVSVIAAIVMTLLYAVVATGLGTALWGFGKVDSSFVANACKGIGIEFLLVSAFTAVFVMFSMLIRQSGGAIAANIFFLEFISLIVMFGEMIINKIFDTSITLSNYLIDTDCHFRYYRKTGRKKYLRSFRIFYRCHSDWTDFFPKTRYQITKQEQKALKTSCSCFYESCLRLLSLSKRSFIFFSYPISVGK